MRPHTHTHAHTLSSQSSAIHIIIPASPFILIQLLPVDTWKHCRDGKELVPTRNTHPHTHTLHPPPSHTHTRALTSAVCPATTRGEGRGSSRTDGAVHILQPPHPSFGHSKEGGRGEERQGGRENREGGREGGEKEGYEIK